MLEMRIGIVDTAKEIALELDEDQAELKSIVESALAEGTRVLWLSDRKGRQVGIPAAKLAYVEIDSETSGRSVGFAP